MVRTAQAVTEHAGRAVVGDAVAVVVPPGGDGIPVAAAVGDVGIEKNLPEQTVVDSGAELMPDRFGVVAAQVEIVGRGAEVRDDTAADFPPIGSVHVEDAEPLPHRQAKGLESGDAAGFELPDVALSRVGPFCQARKRRVEISAAQPVKSTVVVERRGYEEVSRQTAFDLVGRVNRVRGAEILGLYTARGRSNDRDIAREKGIGIGWVLDDDLGLPGAVEAGQCVLDAPSDPHVKDAGTGPHDRRIVESEGDAQPWVEVVVVSQIGLPLVAQAEEHRDPIGCLKFVLEERVPLILRDFENGVAPVLRVQNRTAFAERIQVRKNETAVEIALGALVRHLTLKTPPRTDRPSVSAVNPEGSEISP